MGCNSNDPTKCGNCYKGVSKKKYTWVNTSSATWYTGTKRQQSKAAALGHKAYHEKKATQWPDELNGPIGY